MTKPTAWMPMYWGDYLRDTGHLTTHQHGAYLLLIAHYWSSGQALPDDDLRLQKITRVPPHLWRVVKPILAAFFKVENGRWYHSRIERELTGAFDRSDHGRRGANARWRPKAGDGNSDARASIGHRLGNASHNHIKNHESLTTNSTVAARDPAQPEGSGPRARRETSKERLLRLAEAHRQQTLRKGQP